MTEFERALDVFWKAHGDYKRALQVLVTVDYAKPPWYRSRSDWKAERAEAYEMVLRMHGVMLLAQQAVVRSAVRAWPGVPPSVMPTRTEWRS